jgi:hypothetical protein
VAVVAPLAVACTPTTNDPDEYGATTEANVLDGCVRAQFEDPGDTRVVTVEESDSGDDQVVVDDSVSDALLDPCQCVYDGIVEEIPFAAFEEMDDEDLAVALGGEGESSDDGGDGTTTTTSDAEKKLGDIVDGCPFPPS